MVERLTPSSTRRVRRRLLAAMGDANDPLVWSGIPYHLMQAASQEQIFDEALPLRTPGGLAHSAVRALWSVRRLFAGHRYGGYQYSETAMRRLWSPAIEDVEGTCIVNLFQLYPERIRSDRSISRWFYIDATLHLLCEEYGLASRIGGNALAAALFAEREGYQGATGVIAHSEWAQKSVIEDYGLSPDRVHVVKPGANLDGEAYRRWLAHAERDTSGAPDRPLQLVFVGSEGYRKGLDRLLAALPLARSRGASTELTVIGCSRETMPRHLREIDGVRWLGYIYKHREPDRFIREIAACDVGCLLSRAEAGGISLLEFRALGLVLLGTNAGGSAELLIPGASVVVPKEANSDEIADLLCRLAQDHVWLARMKRHAWEHKHSVTWNSRARQLDTLLMAHGD